MSHLVLPLALAAIPLLGACATTSREPSEPQRRPVDQCEASAARDMVGSRATAEAGARLLERTGAETLRWVPPRTAVTMDFRPDRLTVKYDDDFEITSIDCG